MPELPEVETMCRGISPIIGQRIRDVQRAPCGCKPISVKPRIDHFNRRAQGAEVLAIGRAGKRVLVELSGGDTIVFEPRMTGLVLLADPPDYDYLRLTIHFKSPRFKSPPLSYWDRRGLGNVRLLSPEQRALAFSPEKLGPDALEITAGELQRRLSDSRREIKVALLDQRVTAGIGNLYASEILHWAGIHPERPCNRLRADHWRRIRAATQDILRTAIRYEGSTLGDGTYRNALNQAGSYQNHHQVYNREGELCDRCGKSKIARIVQAQRVTFFCRTCQKKGRVGAK